MSGLLESAIAAADAQADIDDKRRVRMDAAEMLYGRVLAVGDDGTLDLSINGDTVPGVRMTTACAGVQVGDSVIVTKFGAKRIATGVLARDNRHYVVEQLTDKITLTVYGRMAVVSADFLDITKVNTITKVTELPSWCVPVDLPGSIEWIGYLFTRGGQSYGQIMLIGQDVMAYASNTGPYHSGQVIFPIEPVTA